MEKRTYHRVGVDITANCLRNCSSSPRERFQCVLKDVSVRGARLATNQELKVPEWFFMQFNVPGHFFPFLVCGEVVWLTKEELGVKFFRIDDPDRQRLGDFISSNKVG